MNDDDIAARLRGIDGPRPLPGDVRAAIEARLALALADAPRAVPADLRHRLESSMAAATLPPRVDRRLMAALARTEAPALRVAAALVVAVLLLGVVVARTRDGRDGTLLASPPTTTPTTSVQASAPLPGTAVEPAPGTVAAGGSAVPPPFTEPAAPTGPDDAAPAGATAGVASSSSDALLVRVVGGGTDVAAGFDAYLEVLNAAGGVRGRRVEAVADAGVGRVAAVNLSMSPVAHDGGVLFETVSVDDRRLRDEVVSISSPIEAQARLAVRGAFPEPTGGATAAVYTTADALWFDRAAPAFEDELRSRGVAVVRVPFDPRAPRLVRADAAFLALPAEAVPAWLDAAAGEPAPPAGTWGVASAWDDAFAAAGAGAALHVQSPYEPAAADEAASLVTRVGRLSAGAVHGWVTAKAIAHLLFEHGGEVITTASLDDLAGWSSGWSPPFEVRPGTRARTPEAVPLVPGDGGFRPEGGFARA